MNDVAPPIADGRYRLVDIIGTGGMSTVYRAIDTHQGDAACAVKLVNERLIRNPTTSLRFQREGRTMLSITHPHVMKVFDVGMDRTAYMVMELVTGGNIAEWVDKHGPMPARLAVEVLIQILSGLQVAHETGIVHRDVKPGNIMLTEQGVPKLSDFGIARVADTVHNLTASNALLGTWPFMAPEQRANPSKVDPRTDLYSVAATLVNMTTARIPLHLYRKDAHLDLFGGIPAVLHPIISKSGRYKQEDRHNSARELREALIEVVDRLPPTPETTPKLGGRSGLTPVASPSRELSPVSSTFAMDFIDDEASEEDDSIADVETFVYRRTDQGLSKGIEEVTHATTREQPAPPPPPRDMPSRAPTRPLRLPAQEPPPPSLARRVMTATMVMTVVATLAFTAVVLLAVAAIAAASFL